jgi:hypothetical protein
MSHERAKELVELFDDFTGTYLRAEVEEALTLRDEITPLLIEILEEVAADPFEYAELDRPGHEYAVALLAHFREPAAHLPIIMTFSIAREELELIWGDMVTETLPALLFRTACGNYDAVKELILNRKAEEFVRAGAMEVILLAVASGELPREEALAFYATLFDESLARPDEYFWVSLVDNLLDLYPGDLIGRIRDLCASGKVEAWEVSPEEIDEVMNNGLDKTLAKLPELLAKRVPEDVHDYLSWFACFRENTQEPNLHAPSPLKALKKQKTKARSKRKQGKASKRKNRK